MLEVDIGYQILKVGEVDHRVAKVGMPANSISFGSIFPPEGFVDGSVAKLTSIIIGALYKINATSP